MHETTSLGLERALARIRERAEQADELHRLQVEDMREAARLGASLTRIAGACSLPRRTVSSQTVLAWMTAADA